MVYPKTPKIVCTIALGLSLFAGGSVTSATEGGYGANYNSKANIMFKLNEGPGPGVVDPDDPDTEKPVNPTDPVKPGTNGPLSIDYVSDFHFGEQTITDGNKAAVYHAALTKLETVEGEQKSVANFLQVTDARANGVVGV